MVPFDARAPGSEIDYIKQRIKAVHARRERLKRALEDGDLPMRAGLAQLQAVDQELSSLDSRYKQLWDATRMPSPSPMP